MSLLEPPLKLRLFWDCEIKQYSRGYFFSGAAKKTFSLNHVISYSELEQKICAYRGLDQMKVKLGITMRHPDVFGSTVNFSMIQISDDDDMQNLWDHSCAFRGQAVELKIHTETVENVVPIQGSSFGVVGPLTTVQNALSPKDIPNIGVQAHVTMAENVMGFPSVPPPPVKVTNVTSSTDSNSQSMPTGCVPPTNEIPAGRNFQRSRNALNPTMHENISLDVTPIDNCVASEPCRVGDTEAIVDGLGTTSKIDGLVDSEVPNGDEFDHLDADESDGPNLDGSRNINPPGVDVPQGSRGSNCPIDDFAAGPTVGHSMRLYEPPYARFLENLGCYSQEHDTDVEGDGPPKICIDQWSECNSELKHGMRFLNKKQVVYAVRKWSVQRGREFQVTESKSKSWSAKCKNSTSENPCPWKIRVIKRAKRDIWQITGWYGEHICITKSNDGNHQNLSAKFIASHVLHLVEQDSKTKISDIIDHVVKTLHHTPSYKKAYEARKHAIDMLHGVDTKSKTCNN